MPDDVAPTAGTQLTKVAGHQNLYLHANQTYYARFSQNGRQTSQSLKVKRGAPMTQVAILLAKKMLAVKKGRSAPEADGPAVKTMGDLTALLLRQLETSPQSGATKTNYREHLALAGKFWPGAVSYEKTPPRNVTRDVLFQLRDRLKADGYSNSYTNQVIARVGNVLGLARERHLMVDNPLETTGPVGLRGSLWLPVKPRKPHLPDLADMERVFVEMAHVVPGKRGKNGATAEDPAFVQWRQERAIDAAHHARFLAYSGARLEEGNAAEFKDDKGTTFHIRGTKTAASDRFIPVSPQLRDLLTEIKARRAAQGLPAAGRVLVPKTSRDALKKACARIGLPRLGHHDLRHWFISVALTMPGATVVIVADWVGHDDKGATLLKVYAHILDGHSREVGKSLNFQPPAAATTPA